MGNWNSEFVKFVVRWAERDYISFIRQELGVRFMNSYILICTGHRLVQFQHNCAIKHKTFTLVNASDRPSNKVHIFWEGRKILRNLHQLFDWQYIGLIIVGDFTKLCGLLRIYELYKNYIYFLHDRRSMNCGGQERFYGRKQLF